MHIASHLAYLKAPFGMRLLRLCPRNPTTVDQGVLSLHSSDLDRIIANLTRLNADLAKAVLLVRALRCRGGLEVR